MSNTISFKSAIFAQEHKSEIEEIVEEFKRLRGKILPNTLLQLTRWDLIEKFYDLSPIVDDGEITEHTLNLIVKCIDEAKGVVSSEDYKKLEKACRTFSALKSKRPDLFQDIK